MRELLQGWPCRLVLALHAVGALAQYPPTEAASSIGFTDDSPIAGKLKGNITVVPGKLSLEPFEYRVYFATIGFGDTLDTYRPPWPIGAPVVIFETLTANAPAAQEPFTFPVQGQCLENKSYLYSDVISCEEPVDIPQGATHLLVRSQNKYGTLDIGQLIKLVDWTGAVPAIPNAIPWALNWVDEDQDRMSIGGTLHILITAPEPLDIAWYRVYWHGIDGIIPQVMDGGLRDWVLDVPATGYGIGDTKVAFQIKATIRNGSTTPGAARRLYVLAMNRDGVALDGRTVAIKDRGYPTEEHTSYTLAVGIAIGAAVFLFTFAMVVVLLRSYIVRRCYGRKHDSHPIVQGSVVDKEPQKLEEKPKIPWQQMVHQPTNKQETPDTFFANAHVECWDAEADNFVHATVMDDQAVMRIKGSIPTSIHSKPGEQPRPSIWLQTSHDKNILEDVHPGRIRLRFLNGETVEIFQRNEWLPGVVEQCQNAVLYDVSLQLGMDVLLSNVHARDVRRCLKVDSLVEVWSDAQWKVGKIISASPNVQDTERHLTNRALFVSQQVTVSTPGGNVEASSKDIRWLTPAKLQVANASNSSVYNQGETSGSI